MQLTPAGLAILLLAVPAFVASAYFPAATVVGLAWLIGIPLLAVLDSVLTRRGLVVEIQRRVDEKLSLGAANRIVLRVRSRCHRPVELRIKDSPPVAFSTPERAVRVSVAPYDTLDASYLTIPRGRGDFTFGDIHVRGLGRLALSTWQTLVPARRCVKVYPNLLEVGRYELMSRMDRLQDVGFMRAGLRGRGTEFESLREYVQDDEFRAIDWKATARRRKPIVREHEVERSQNLVLMLDAGRMMTAEVGGMSKLDHAVNAALMLAHVACSADDAVGMIAFGRQVESFVPARKGRAQVGRILEQLYAVQPTLDEPDYRTAFSLLADRMRKRALVAIFTDLVDADASQRLLSHVAALRPRHLPLLITMRDTDLVGLSRQTPHEVQDVYRRAIAADALAQRDAALAWTRSRGAGVLDVPAGKLTVSVVNEYLRLKARGTL